MSLLKAQIRSEITRELGADLEDQLEAAKREVAQHEGAKTAFGAAKQAIASLHEHVKRDIDDGKLDLVTASTINLWISRAAQLCENLAMQTSQALIGKQGAVLQNERLVQILKKRFDAEQAALRTIAQRAVQTGQEEITLAQHIDAPPAPKSIKQIRLEEAAREAAESAKPIDEMPRAPKPVQRKKNGRRGAHA